MHAVVDDTHVYTLDKDQNISQIEHPSVTNATDLWQLGQELNITHFWVMPASRIDQMGSSFFNINPDEWNVFITYEDEETKEFTKFFRIYAKGKSGHQVRVGYAHRGRFLWEIREPRDILLAISYLEKELAVPVQWSPKHVGLTLLKQLNDTPIKKRWIEPATIDLSFIPFGQAARDILFLRALTSADIGCYVHGIDKNSAHTNAMRDLYVGAGNPVRVEMNGIMREKRDIKEAGVYHVSIFVMSRFDGRDLPLVINREWATTEMINFAFEQGDEVLIHEAYVFQESHRTLRSWAEKLWSARSHLRDDAFYPESLARDNAYHTTKTIMNVCGGSLTSAYESPFQRPDWHAAMVGRARVVELWNILAHEKADGVLPFLIYTDALFYVSPHENIEDALPSELRRKNGFGGYKPVISVPITADMVEYSQKLKQEESKGSSKAGKMLNYLKEVQRGKR